MALASREPILHDPKLIEEYGARVDALVAYYAENIDHAKRFQTSVLGYLQADSLRPLIHSIRSRLKSQNSLKDKLFRQIATCIAKKVDFDIVDANLFERITDLVGVRILHLHTTQFAAINKIIHQIIDDETLSLVEGPIARIWDIEYSDYFKSIGVATENNKRMYTSVHYTIGSRSRFKTSCELQVRTLSQELWGEVDHQINYPHPVDNLACREQIKALARITSGAGRLVDSIYASYEDMKKK
jgi:ppGpp synthetase/RelA/SpoT-type nucleotidyltranferase